MIQIILDKKTRHGSVFVTDDPKDVGLELNILLDHLYDKFPGATLAAIEVFMNEKLNS